METRIRPMKLEDLDQVLEVEQLSFNSPWPRSSFEFELGSNPIAKYLVAEVEGKIVGYAGVWLIIDESHVTNICVLPAYRGQGLGDRLFLSLLRLAQDSQMASMTLEVRESNLVAQGLYGKYGFKSVGIREKYYKDSNEDGIIMVKEFKDR